jgi:hypothetical protein
MIAHSGLLWLRSPQSLRRRCDSNYRLPAVSVPASFSSIPKDDEDHTFTGSNEIDVEAVTSSQAP